MYSETTPPCLSFFLSLPPFLPILPLHSPSTRWSTNRDGISSSTRHSIIQNFAPRRQTFKRIPKWRDVSPAYMSTEKYLHMESTTCNYTTKGAPVADGLSEESNAIGDSRKKRQRQKHAHHRQQFTRAQLQAVDYGENLDANQSN